MEEFYEKCEKLKNELLKIEGKHEPEIYCAVFGEAVAEIIASRPKQKREVFKNKFIEILNTRINQKVERNEDN